MKYPDGALITYIKQLQEELKNEKNLAARQTKSQMIWRLLLQHGKL